MKFELLPTIDIMLKLYAMPLSIERFNAYLKTLHGDTKDDLVMPLGSFNPMAKEHAITKLQELKQLHAEEIIADILIAVNSELKNEKENSVFKVALNLSDDLQGGWTNRYTSDYDSKFRIGPLVNREFCTPIFWTSENFSEEPIKTRTLEYVYRTIHWLRHPKPKTLEEHLNQEKFAATKSKRELNFETAAETFYQAHRTTEDYHIIFNFLYGDAASKSLEFPAFGRSGIIGDTTTQK